MYNNLHASKNFEPNGYGRCYFLFLIYPNSIVINLPQNSSSVLYRLKAFLTSEFDMFYSHGYFGSFTVKGSRQDIHKRLREIFPRWYFGLIFRNFLWRCSHLKYITDTNFISYTTFRFKYQLTYQLHIRLSVVLLTKCTQLLFT